MNLDQLFTGPLQIIGGGAVGMFTLWAVGAWLNWRVNTKVFIEQKETKEELQKIRKILEEKGAK